MRRLHRPRFYRFLALVGDEKVREREKRYGRLETAENIEFLTEHSLLKGNIVYFSM